MAHSPSSHLPDAAYSFTDKQEKQLLLILSAIQFTHVLDFVIMMPLGPQLMRVFGLSPQQFSLLVSAYTLSAGISGFTGAFFLDRFDRRTALLVLYLGFAVGTLACALSPNYYFLLSARILSGLFGGVLGALILAMIGDAVPESRRGAAMGKVMAAYSVASVVGIPLGLYLTTLISWHAPFILLAGMSAWVLGISLRVLPSMRKHLTGKLTISPLWNLRIIGRNPRARWALLLMVMLNVAGWLVVPFLSPYMVANVGFEERQLPYLYLFGGGLTYFTSPYIGKLADRYGKGRVFTCMAFLSLFPVLFITRLPAIPIWQALILTTLYFVMNMGRFVPAVALVTSSVAPQQRGCFMSLNASLQSLAAGVAALAAGQIVQQAGDHTLSHFDWVGIASAFSILICLGICRRLDRGNRQIQGAEARSLATIQTGKETTRMTA